MINDDLSKKKSPHFQEKHLVLSYFIPTSPLNFCHKAFTRRSVWEWTLRRDQKVIFVRSQITSPVVRIIMRGVQNRLKTSFQLNLQRSLWSQLKTTPSSIYAYLEGKKRTGQTVWTVAFCKHNTKLPNCCLSSAEMVSLRMPCTVAAGDFPAHALFFDTASRRILLTFNFLSEPAGASSDY